MEALELAVGPLDFARRAFMQVATRSAFVTRMLARRDSRVVVLASSQVLALFVFAVWAPVGLFYLGPVLFGVAHLAADVRYLILHRHPPRALVIASALFALAITALQAGAGLHATSTRTTEQWTVALGVAWVGAGLVVALRSRALHAVAAIVATIAFARLGAGHARVIGLALVHGHNLIAIAIWLAFFRRRVRWAATPVLLVLGLGALLLSGATLGWTYRLGGSASSYDHLETLGSWLAPGVRPGVAAAIACVFVFLQGVHYAAWTAWIPQDDLRTEGTPTFRMSVRALARDFSVPALGFIVIAAASFVILACVDLRSSVGWYLVLAKSHGWLELAFVAYMLASRDRLRGGAA